jgi:hypothetical protein
MLMRCAGGNQRRAASSTNQYIVRVHRICKSQALQEAKQDLLKARREHTEEDAMLSRYIAERDQAKKCA